MNYKFYYEKKVKAIIDYLKKNDLKAMVLGISGGIDSTVVAALCHEVSKRTGIPLVGRSLPIKNGEDEMDASVMVGLAFCNDFKCVNMHNIYEAYLGELETYEKGLTQTPIANGNIQARLRMTYLYNLAGIMKGIVMDTDNMTENNLGFFTIHGDQGDLNPIHDLWKTQVYELADYILGRYRLKAEVQASGGDTQANGVTNYVTEPSENGEDEQTKVNTQLIIKAMSKSIGLTPTDGLGISNSDLEQIGAESYKDVDDILGYIVENDGEIEGRNLMEKIKKYGMDVVGNILSRHVGSQYKRLQTPIEI